MELKTTRWSEPSLFTREMMAIGPCLREPMPLILNGLFWIKTIGQIWECTLSLALAQLQQEVARILLQ